jgi:hypothetical protein
MHTEDAALALVGAAVRASVDRLSDKLIAGSVSEVQSLLPFSSTKCLFEIVLFEHRMNQKRAAWARARLPLANLVDNSTRGLVGWTKLWASKALVLAKVFP